MRILLQTAFYNGSNNFLMLTKVWHFTGEIWLRDMSLETAYLDISYTRSFHLNCLDGDIDHWNRKPSRWVCNHRSSIASRARCQRKRRTCLQVFLLWPQIWNNTFLHKIFPILFDSLINWVKVEQLEKIGSSIRTFGDFINCQLYRKAIEKTSPVFQIIRISW